MRALVLDASAAVAWVAGEPSGARVEEVIGSREVVLVPWLLWVEVVDALALWNRWPPARQVEAIHHLEGLGIRTEAPSRPTLLATIDAVDRHGLTAYDATYLVLAETADADLLTADASLARAAGARAIFVGAPHRLSDARATYVGRSPGQAESDRWLGAAEYIAELRREIAAEEAGLRTGA
jgi:predicted nucleic acid-binding protein